MTPLLSVRDLTKHYDLAPDRWFGRGKTETVRAVDGVTFDICHGETLGLVGESGCGKSSVGRAILNLSRPTAGTVALEGRPIQALGRAAMRPVRRDLQVVFQDPFSSLNPRMTVRDIVAEPLRNFASLRGAVLDLAVRELLEKVGLSADAMDRQPHQFSGGQRQRIGIARALALRPKLIVLDEPVSALDVSVQAQVVNLLVGLQAEFGLSYLFIAHDLAVVEHISHRVAVMYLGKVVEIADRQAIFAAPRHPYTRALLSAVPIHHPRAERRRIILEGDIPSPVSPPAGCRFHTRCPQAFDRCRAEEPALQSAGTGSHLAACHLVDQRDGISPEPSPARHPHDQADEGTCADRLLAKDKRTS